MKYEERRYMKIELMITKENIKKGIKKDPCFCPIACAAKEIFGDSVEVGEDVIEMNDLSFDLPTKAIKFISDFDSGKKVKPFILKLKK